MHTYLSFYSLCSNFKKALYFALLLVSGTSALAQTNLVASADSSVVATVPSSIPASVSSSVSSTVPSTEDRSALMILGDSISAGYGIREDQGWVQLLARTLTETELPWDTINASISGETTSGGLARLPELLDTHSPELLVIELGGNDGLRGYPTHLMQQNIENMVSMAREAGATPVLMAMRIPPNYGPRYTRAFEQVYRTIAEQEEILYIPFFLEEIAVQEGMMQDDGIHPTAIAQPLMRDFVWPYLEPLFSAEEDS